MVPRGTWLAIFIGAALAACSHLGPKDEADASTADGDADSDTGTDTETVTDPDVVACVETYGWPCDCEGACDDGFGYTVFYPASAGEFLSDTYPSDELLEVGIGWLYCSVCDPCEAWQRVKFSGVWTDMDDIYGFCLLIAAYDDECGGCLVTVSGGGG
jgi:hypothetical protein